MNSTTPIIPIRSSSEPPLVLTPDSELFAVRARRLEQLAEGHSLGDWLRFLAVLSRAQHQALQTLPADLPLPTPTALQQSRDYGMPTLPAQSWPRDPAWHGLLHQIVAAVMPNATEAARSDLERMGTLSTEHLEALAEQVLHTELYGDDVAILPYVAAALQVLWTGLAIRLNTKITALDVAGVCPCCGYLPVASIVKTAGDVANLRFLHCALCNTEWNLVRVKCAACDANENISYRQLEGDGLKNPEAVRAETCETCMSYLKIVYVEKGGLDPVADDLATLALDILVDEAGYSRAGPNLLLMPGEG